MLNGRARFCILGVGFVALLCASCTKGGPPVYPVHGQVSLDGKAPEGAMVVFHPASDTGLEAIKPIGRVKADGSFTVDTYFPAEAVTRHGAPAGDYRVTISWFPTEVTQAGANARAPAVLPDKLQGRYGDPKTSGLRAQVKEEDNQLSPFRLTGN